MKVFKIYSTNPQSDYWKIIVMAENGKSAIETAKKYYLTGEDISSAEEIVDPQILAHSNYKWK